MRVELGNARPKHQVRSSGSACGCCGRTDAAHEELPGPAVTYLTIPDDYTMAPGADVNELALHLARNPDVTHLPDHEAFLVVAHPAGGMWPEHRMGADPPTWVHVEGPDQEKADELQRVLSEFYGASSGRPDDVEGTHWTRHGMPGVGPLPDAEMTKVNAGNDQQSLMMGLGGGVFGQTGTATATSATTLTGGTESPGGSHGTNDAKGLVIVAWSNGAIGYVKSNTSGTSPVYTIDRWMVPGSPGGAAASTPSATTGYTLVAGTTPAFFMGLTANSSAVGSGDTTLPSEITTASGGLIRKICPIAHTASAASYTLTPVFTANGSDSLPVTIAKIGVSPSLTSGVDNLFQTLLGTTATLSLSGDQLTISEVISL